jgi:excinuclease ABC subunit C
VPNSAQPPDLTEKLRALPHRPGVYLYRDRLHRVIYVGKARDLSKRVHQYFHPSRRELADLKTRALVDAIWDIEWHTVRSEPEALLLEGRLIKEYRPKYNISFRDDKRFLLVKVNLADPFPRFMLTRLRKDDGCRYFGPFAHSSALRATLNVIKKQFGLRSCRPPVPDERDHKHCLDHVIRNCSAPCIAKITRDEYVARVKQACEFLEGRSREFVEQMEAEMKAAAERLDFERAALLRNVVDDLRRTTRPSRRFVRDVPSTVVPERDVAALQEALRLPEPPAHLECFDISNITTTHVVASVVVFRDGRPRTYDYRRYRIKTVEGQNDFASMAEVVLRRYRRVLGLSEAQIASPAPPPLTAAQLARLPSLIIVDGGKGQLSAAIDSLTRLGIEEQPVIGLAKQREEIFLPHQPDPLVLPHESGALRLLQRIRDEAHRVANGYHQLLLARRVSESILDDCPGINDTRKRALLAHFGSVRRVRRATADEIAAIPGIGPRIASQVAEFFAHQHADESQPSAAAH